MADTGMDVDQPKSEAEAGADPGKAEPSSGSAGVGNSEATMTIAGAVPVRSIEGWIVMVSNVHEEASEEDLQDLFGDFGDIKNIHMNLDRRTGYVKGYALVEFTTKQEASAAIQETNGKKLLDQTLAVDFAFVRPEEKKTRDRGDDRRRESRRIDRERERSRSPGAD